MSIKQDGRLKLIIGVLETAVGGGLAVMFPKHQILIIAVTAIVIILCILLWPEKIKTPRRRIYKPDLEEERRREEAERVIAEHQVWWNKFEDVFVKAGWKVETVDTWRYVWFWDKYLKDKNDKWPWA